MASCHCSGAPPLCTTCVESALTRPLLRIAQRLGERWGRDVYRRRPGETWPHWDADVTGRLRAWAFQTVAHLHQDPRVLDRLARTCAYHAGVAYRDAPRLAAGRADRGAR